MAVAVSPTPAQVEVILTVLVSLAAATEYVAVPESKVGERFRPLLSDKPVIRFSVAAARVALIVYVVRVPF